MYEKIKDLLRQKKEIDKDYPISAEDELLKEEAKRVPERKYVTSGIVNSMAFVDFGDGRLVPLNTEAKPVEELKLEDNKAMQASTPIVSTTMTGRLVSDDENYVAAKRTEDLAVENLIQGLKELTKRKMNLNEQAVLNLGNAEYDERFGALNRRIEQLEDLVKVLEKKVVDLQQVPFVQPYNPIPTPYPYPYPVYPNPWYDPYRPTITTTGSTNPNTVKYSTTTGGTSIDTGTYKDLDKYYAELLKEDTR